jgi:two-component sensor histidine kinase
MALQLLRGSQNRIRPMALVHQTHYRPKDFVRVDFRVNRGNSTTLGQQLIELLSDQVGSQLTVQRPQPTGFVLKLAVEP